MEDDIIYDGWALPNDHFLFSTPLHWGGERREGTLWAYRLTAPAEVKSGVPLSNGSAAVLNSQEQAILEIETSTIKVLRRIPMPAKGTDHTRYMLTRSTPQGNYLVALREKRRALEVSPAGEILHGLSLPSMPVMAQRDGVQSFAIDAANSISWTLPASEFTRWKRSETEPRTGFVEHRSISIQPLHSASVR